MRFRDMRAGAECPEGHPPASPDRAKGEKLFRVHNRVMRRANNRALRKKGNGKQT